MPTTTDAAPPELQELARLYGIETAYEDAAKETRTASAASLLATLRVLGAPVHRPGDVHDALRERRQALARRGLEPVAVAWDGRCDELALHLPAKSAAHKLHCLLRLEDGAVRQWDVDATAGQPSATVEGVPYAGRRLALPGTLPEGYHRLTVDAGGHAFEALVVSAPRRAYVPPDAPARTWGVFLPLYAVRSGRDWGAGDFTDLGQLLDWVHGLGGGVVATLPLLAAFLDRPFEPSPYSPASRLFWNEFYLDVAAIPEFARCSPGRALLDAPGAALERSELRTADHVDYRRLMAMKRRVLEELARCFFADPGPRRHAFEQFLQEHEAVKDYAAFRAAGERRGAPWPDWPAPQRDGTLTPADYDEAAWRYHVYVQWAAEEQLAALSARARRAGPGLYLDLPLGVHGHGYDVWRERDAFAVGASGGAPPDLVFPRGQDWGFPPLHPEHIRNHDYRYVTSYLRRQLRFAGILRIDHMPVFHRLFWVPQGMEAKDGVYVRYPAEELYAVFSLESHRHRAMLVGEDLGTVPPEVPASMARHNFHRMYVVQYELKDDPEKALPAPPAGAVASVNTHDMPPFAAYWQGQDIDDRGRLGLLGGQDPLKEHATRKTMLDALTTFLRSAGLLDGPADATSVLRGCLAYLAGSEARLVLVNLEDLWQETRPQNVPSTTDRCPNWCRKARYTLEELAELSQVRAILEEVHRQTQRAVTPERAAGRP